MILILILIFSFSFADLLKPIDSATLNQTHIKFEWEQEPNATFYVLDLADDSNIDQNCIICDHYIGESLIYIEKELIEWNTTYHWKVIAYTNDGQSNLIGTSSFNTSNPIGNVETILHSDTNQDGVTIFGSFLDYYTAVIDENGNEIWNSGDQDLVFYNTDQYGRFFGTEYLGSQVANTYPGLKFSFEDGVQWQDPGDEYSHHDIFQLPNGNYIGLVTSSQMGPIPLGSWTALFQFFGYAADGETIEFQWVGDKIIEWDATTKEEVWSWNTFDYFDMNDYDILGGEWNDAAVDIAGGFDWTHANAMWFDEDDSAIYLSSRNLNRITKIDYPSGEIIWNLGHELGSGDIDCGQDIGFSYQHSLTKLQNGNILIFDNGVLSVDLLDTEEPTSRSIEIQIDENNNGCIAELGWEYILPFYGDEAGNTQKLENGNYLATTIGGGGRSFEVNQNRDKVWEADYNLSLPVGLVYRAMRIPGLFPIAYSVIFPQFETSTSEMNLDENEALTVLISNDGDYKQIFDYSLMMQPIDVGYNVEFSITPRHHPSQSKNSTFFINTNGYTFDTLSQTNSITINSNEKIELTLTDILSNNLINNLTLELKAAYPNPFNPNVNFQINSLKREYVEIDIYNVLGYKIENIFTGYINNGKHLFSWDATNNTTGLYIIKVVTKNKTLTQKINLIK